MRDQPFDYEHVCAQTCAHALYAVDRASVCIRQVQKNTAKGKVDFDRFRATDVIVLQGCHYLWMSTKLLVQMSVSTTKDATLEKSSDMHFSQFLCHTMRKVQHVKKKSWRYSDVGLSKRNEAVFRDITLVPLFQAFCGSGCQLDVSLLPSSV